MDYNVKVVIGQTEYLEEQVVEYEDYNTVREPSITDITLINNACSGTLEIGATASDQLKFRILNPDQTIYDGEAVELWVQEPDTEERPRADEIEDEVGDETADEAEYDDDEEEVADPDEEGEDLDPEDEEDADTVDEEMEAGLTEQLTGEDPDPETDVDPDPGEPSWIRIGTFYVYNQTNNADGSISLVCYDGFLLMAGQFKPTNKVATIASMYEDLRTQTLANCGISVDAEDFGDFANESMTIDYILSYREALGYFAGILGGFVEFADDGTCGISQYGYDDNVLIDSELISYAETSAGEMVVESVSCNRSRAAMSEDIIEAGQGGQEISFVNPHVTQSMLDAVYESYKGMRFVGATLQAPWRPELTAGEFVRVFSEDEYKNFLMLRNNLDQNGGEMTADEIAQIQADMNSLGRIVLISSQTVSFNGNATTTIQSVCGTETEKSNPPATRLEGLISAAGETASKYITYVDTEHGIRVYDGEPSNEDVNFAQMNAGGMQIYKGGVNVASFGENARVGEESGSNVFIKDDSIQMLKSGVVCSVFSLPVESTTDVMTIRYKTTVQSASAGSMLFYVPGDSFKNIPAHDGQKLVFTGPNGETGQIGTTIPTYDADDPDTWFRVLYDLDGTASVYTAPGSSIPDGAYVFRFIWYVNIISAQCYVGCYPDMLDGEVMFGVGNGESDSERSNAFTVDWLGNVMASGEIKSKTVVEDITTFASGWGLFSGYSCKIRRSGNVVELNGAIRNNSAVTLNTVPQEVFYLSSDWSDYFPPAKVFEVCNGSSRAKFLIAIDPAGTVTFERATANGSSYDSFNAGSWWPFHVVWIV